MRRAIADRQILGQGVLDRFRQIESSEGVARECEGAAPSRPGPANPRQDGDGAVDRGDEDGTERDPRRHGPAITIDEVGAPRSQWRDQHRQPPWRRPDVRIEQHDVRIIGLELCQRGEKVGAFLAAQRRETGDDELDIELRKLLGERCDAPVSRVFARLDRNDQSARLQRLGSQSSEQILEPGERACYRQHQGDAHG